MSVFIDHGDLLCLERRRAELKLADQVRKRNKFKVIDLCCRRFPRGFGVDLHPESNADLLCDVQNLKPIESESFDFALCVEGVEHLFNPSQAVREWARVSKYALIITTQNAHCWRRWMPFFARRCTSPDHITMWDQYTLRNFFRNNFPDAEITIGWYDRYLKKTRNFKPEWMFRENMFAFVWLHPEKYQAKKEAIFKEAMRLINSRPEKDFDKEYSDRKSNNLIKGGD